MCHDWLILIRLHLRLLAVQVAIGEAEAPHPSIA